MMMKAAPGPRERGALRLRSVMSGGEAMGATVFHWCREALGVTPNEIFGQTEINYIVGNTNALWPVKPGSMGRPYPGHRIAVIGEDGRELPRGAPGGRRQTSRSAETISRRAARNAGKNPPNRPIASAKATPPALSAGEAAGAAARRAWHGLARVLAGREPVPAWEWHSARERRSAYVALTIATLALCAVNSGFVRGVAEVTPSTVQSPAGVVQHLLALAVVAPLPLAAWRPTLAWRGGGLVLPPPPPGLLVVQPGSVQEGLARL